MVMGIVFSIVCSLVFFCGSVRGTCPCTPETLNIAQVLDCGYDKTLIDIPVRLCDYNDRKVKIESLTVDQTGTAQGALHQIASNFAKFGYEPKVEHGATAIAAGDEITDSGKRHSRLVWRMQGKCPTNGVRFTVSASSCNTKSAITDVVLVPESRKLVSSDFSLNVDGWTILGKEGNTYTPSYETTSRGSLNQYIHYEDKEVKQTSYNSKDDSKWYFVAPNKFLLNGIHPAYYGTLDFTIGMSCGQPNNLNDDSYLVLIECDACASGTGTTIAYGRLGDGVIQKSMQSQQISIPLTESSWKKDPENELVAKSAWSPPTQQEFIEVLSKVSKIKILGDLTTWHECTAIDNVSLKVAAAVNSKTKAHVNIPYHLVPHILRP